MLSFKRHDKVIVRDILGKDHELTIVAFSNDYDSALVEVPGSTDNATIRQFSKVFVRKV